MREKVFDLYNRGFDIFEIADKFDVKPSVIGRIVGDEIPVACDLEWLRKHKKK